MSSLNQMCAALPTYSDEYLSSMSNMGKAGQVHPYQMSQSTVPSFKNHEVVDSQLSCFSIDDFMQYY